MNSTESFSARELSCRCSSCKQSKPHQMQEYVLRGLQAIRDVANRPLILTSAYRCANHPDEIKKAAPGRHNQGLAVDIKVSNDRERAEIVDLGLKYGAKGIGVAKSFVHLDWRTGPKAMWLYS
ncbi:endolysin [Shewanella phage SppYZU05]|uniref:Peptidase m15a n=1 Tax=Shewanella phage SppYZU05 TaxID=1970795 RepID=A0A1W6JTJ9_9CAUD|nr:endolysin [Shewanella phage SppYZU05]ARM70591.1 peptidase m15a [Shewanella phage SppYZU05]